MFFGMPHAAGLGVPENAVLWQYADVSDDFVWLDLVFRPSPNMGDAYFGLYVSGSLAKTVYAAEGEELVTRLTVPPDSSSFSYAVFRHGHSGDSYFDASDQARFVEEREGNNRVTIEFTFVPEVMGDVDDDSTSLSSWSLSGLEQGTNTNYVNDYPARGSLDVDLDVTAGVATVTLTANDQEVASGSATISGATTVTLEEQNSSGLSGSVLVQSDAVSDSDIVLYVRWPEEMVVYRDTFSPPTNEQDRVTFQGDNTVRWTEAEDLDPDVYYYRLRPNSDTDDLGQYTSTFAINLDAIPGSPTDLLYLSGNVSNLQLQYSGSSTVGATYRLYGQSNPDDIINMLEPDATAAAGEETISYPLDYAVYNNVPLGFSGFSGFSGYVYCKLEAVHPVSGKEDGNSDMLGLEFDQFGNFVPKRPNAPQLLVSSLSITSGLSLSIQATYDPSAEQASPATLDLFYRTEQGEYDYTSPADSEATTEGDDGVTFATLQYAFPSTGLYYIRALGVAADGTQSHPEDSNELLVYVSDTDMSAPSGFSAYASRS